MACTIVDDNLLDVVPAIGTEVQCQMICAATPTCAYYTWYDAEDNIHSLECFLFSFCDEVDDTCTNCFTGPSVCHICSTPPNIPHGSWRCSTSSDYMECSLECQLGYTPSGRSVTSCSSGTWSTPPAEMTCPAALALVTGGISAYQTVEIYSSDGSCNRRLPDLPDDRYYHTVDYVDGQILLCGGASGNARTSCLAMTEDYTMVPHSTTTVERRDHSSVVMGGQLTLLGGDFSRNGTEFLSPSGTWTEGYPLIEKTIAACTVKLTWDTYLVTGGVNYPWQTHVVLYNNTDGTARRLFNLNEGRSSHGCTLIQNKTYTGVMVAGGWDDNGKASSSTEVMNVAEGAWYMAGNLNNARQDLKILAIEDKIVALGGLHAGGLSTVELFNVATFTWSYTTELLTARYDHAVTTLPVTMFDCDNE